MKLKKYLAYLTAVMMMLCFTACGNSSNNSEAEADSDSSDDIVQEAPETSPVAANGDQDATAIPDVNFEPAYSAESGQAYLAIVDSQWWIQYWGNAEKDGYMLAYNAGIADIHGDGSYTVSVTADTNGFRYDTTGDPNEQTIPEGISFMSLMIPDGEKLYPGAVITIDSIKVDGNELELLAKNYTSSDDGEETRSNIYNAYVSQPADDARSAEGYLYDEDGDATDICDEYSAQIVNPEDFATWTTVEVNFTITGTDGSNARAEDAGDEDAADADAE